MATRKTRTGWYSTNYATDMATLSRPRGAWNPGTTRWILGCHGHGGDSTQYTPVQPVGPVTKHLNDDGGYTMLSVDHARINSWGDSDSLRAMDDAYAFMVAQGMPNGAKIGVMAWSMGGLTSLNWTKRNAAKIAGVWLWNPCTDSRFYHDTNATYPPAYPTSAIAQATYTAEIDTAFTGSTTASGAVTMPISTGAPITVNVANAKGFSDSYRYSVLGKAIATTGTNTFTYTGKTDTALTGCLGTGASFSIANAATITQSYAQVRALHNPHEDAAGWRGLFPIKVSQASDDATVPPGMNNDATNGWVAKVADAAVTLRSPAPTGGHNALQAVPASEVIAFYDSLAW